VTLKVVFELEGVGRLLYNMYDEKRGYALDSLKQGKEQFWGPCSFSFTHRIDPPEELYTLPRSQWVLGDFSFAALPGCCGVVVSHDTVRRGLLYEGNKYFSDNFRRIKEAFAKHLGYSVMIATTDMANLPAVGNMFKSNYKIVDTFSNARTDHLIGIGIKRL
jgi:hypothetical protein